MTSAFHAGSVARRCCRQPALCARFRRLCLAAVAVTIPFTARAEPFYIQDGPSIRYVENGDPAQVVSKEWQIRLYKNGRPTGGKDNWGLITGKSIESVKRQLSNSQDFQRQYAKWAGFDYQTEVYTFFNPLGPIALFRPPSGNPSLLERLAKEMDRFGDVRRTARRIQEFLSDKPSNANPYRGIGGFLMSYGRSLVEAEKKLQELQRRLSVNEESIRALGRDLDALNREITDVSKAGSKIVGTLEAEAPKPAATADMLSAASRGDAAAVHELLTSGTSASATEADGHTGLMYAAQNGSQPVASEFLQFGAGVDQQNADGNTALMYAAARGDSGMVKLLLEHGANPNLTNRDGITPLVAAKSAGDARTVQQLRDAGAK